VRRVAEPIEDGGRAAPAPGRLRPADVLVGAALAASGALLLGLQGRFSFYLDQWDFLLHRRGIGASVFLDPHNDHITIAPVAIYKLLLATVGMGSPLPYTVAAVLAFLLGALLLFVWMRRRVGDWPALLGIVLILFLGAAWEDLLSAFQIGYFGSIAGGLGALLALDRGDRRGDRLACLLLVVAISFSELGVPFAVAALVAVLLGDRPWRQRLYVPLVPFVLYAAWWLGWGASSSFSLHNVAVSPRYVLDAAAAGLAGMLGLSTPPSGNAFSPVGLGVGRVLLLAAVALAAVRLHRRGSPGPGLWIVLAAGLSFWALTAFNQNPFRPPDSSRYVYPSAVFLLLIAAELLRGIRPGPKALAAAAVLTGAVLASNIGFLHQGYKVFRAASEATRGGLAALEIGRPQLRPGFVLDSRIPGPWFVPIPASSYFSAVDDYGSPAPSEAQLASAVEGERASADTVLAAALRIRLAPARGGSGGCRTLPASPVPGPALPLGTGAVVLRNRSSAPVAVLLGRFSDELPVELGTLQPRSAARLRIPPDRSRRPWRLGLRGQGTVAVCGRGSP
jgi:hypothetical protein